MSVIVAGGCSSPRDEISQHLAEGYHLWESVGLTELPESERFVISDTLLSAYQGENAASLATACQCFWLFRKLHGMAERNPVHATLLGDYFFSVFSKNLIPLDSVALNGEFARLLASDTQTPVAIDAFMEFVRNLPAVLEREAPARDQ